MTPVEVAFAIILAGSLFAQLAILLGMDGLERRIELLETPDTP